ncbi:hypothetical protein SmJEL517_g03389 [Synchytrium microbalum]|uniref:Transcription factor CBF/NF-Y/archaeal histone domain-containing protein n=1 Tax=Synchytrium microbalum TaxID=1806994 RepID=A0A507C490_9FUNG|nr:uncharacterized protein SmJEL517_g03389 [Synchytrium microbalum]TPX33909.1 hypothetical protein SmJEL517_g03389 [Synchytrium microbalum]
MDDDELDAPAAADDDLSLPKSTVNKLIQELMPDGLSCAKETRDVLADICTEFIHMLSMEANEISEKEGRKTINPEHVIAALKSLGFDDYIPEIQQVYDDTQNTMKQDKQRKTSKSNATGLSQEELKRQQELLFANARNQMGAGGAGGGPSNNNNNTNTIGLPALALPSTALPSAPLPGIQVFDGQIVQSP